VTNLEQVAVLKKSVSKWNQWREKNPEVTPDLRYSDLQGINLQIANLRETNLQGANLEGANLSEADLVSANLLGANLQGANLQSADLREANLKGANLQNADFRGAWNLDCSEINSAKNFDNTTKFPNYLEVKKIGENKWTCKKLE